MQKLIEGIHHFQSNLFSPQRELFERLAGGQHPDALFITCSDSRINPNLITQTEPGELFIVRNAGNIVPPHAMSSPCFSLNTRLLNRENTPAISEFMAPKKRR